MGGLERGEAADQLQQLHVAQGSGADVLDTIRRPAVRGQVADHHRGDSVPTGREEGELVHRALPCDARTASTQVRAIEGALADS